MRKGTLSSDAPFGTLLGYAPGGVAIYSSNYGSLDPRKYPQDADFRSYIGNEYMGHKWQCVEFARRFLFLNYGFVFTDVGMAWEIFSLRFLRQVVNDNILPLQAFANGSKRAPRAGALLIWQKGGEFHETGHVAVITQLLDDKVRIAEQNVIHSPLPLGQQWTRELRLSVENGCYTLHDTFSDTEILGWMIQTDDTEHSIPQPEIDGELLKISGARLKNTRQFDGKWLNENDALQQAYIRANGHVLEEWVKNGYRGNGHNPAEGLLEELTGAWKHSHARPFVHIMQDNDVEEDYHALFIQRSLLQAGFETKILHGLGALSWDAAGQLIDDEGRHVNCVWKTWAWETAIEQIREVSETEYAAVPIRTGHPEGEVRLIDVLLRPEVLVFEPLWTVIPGNKAILPVLWQLFPNHRYLLDTDFEVNDLLKQTGYAVKPIAGRCGSNIDLISAQDELLDKSSGKFVDRKNIYQQLWCLPKVDGKYIQVCTFTVGGNYGGTCLRGDDSLVVKKESDIEPLIVVKDK